MESQSKDCLVYSYWYATGALASYFSQHKFVSRAHGYDVFENRYNPAAIPFRKLTGEKIKWVTSVSKVVVIELQRNIPSEKVS